MTSRTQILCIVDNMAMRSSAMWREHGLSFWIKTGEMLDASYPGLDFHSTTAPAKPRSWP